jgi:hypothetical protein
MKGSIKITMMVIVVLIAVFVVLFFYPKSLSEIQNARLRLHGLWRGNEGTKFIKENDANSFLITLRENFYRRCQESVKEISSDPILHSVFKKDFFGEFFSIKKWIKKLDSVRGVD